MRTATLAGALPASPESAGNEFRARVSAEQAIPLIELRDIKRTFVTGGGVEVQALRGIDLKIYPGEFVAIVGQSGSGKSTLMNLLGCLDRPTSGTYLFAGRDINSFDADDLAKPSDSCSRATTCCRRPRRKRTSKSLPFTLASAPPTGVLEARRC